MKFDGYLNYKLSDQHLQLLEWLNTAENSTPETNWRKEALEDYKFYSGDQDDPEVLKILAEQNRPNPVFNEIKPKIDMLIGLAAQTKWDIEILPVERADEALAELGLGVLKHFRDKEKFVDKEVEVFEHSIKSGKSYLYFYIDKQNPYELKVKAKRLPGHQCFVDPQSIDYYLEDARYFFIEKWLTEDEIKRMWPDADVSAIPDNSTIDNFIFFNEDNDKYRVMECWYRKYEERIWYVDPLTEKVENSTRKDFLIYSKQLQEGIEIEGEVIQFQPPEGTASWVDVVYYAIFTSYVMLEGGESPFKINTFPVALCGAYKNDDENRWFSVANQMKDPQRATNTLKRQLLHLLQVLPKGILMHEVGAILDIDDYEENSAKPNYHMQLSKGGLERVKFQQQPPISPVYQTLDQVFGQAMRDASGIQNEMMGVQTSSREAGISVKMRRETGLAVLFILFNNYRKFRHHAAMLYFKLLQQFVTTPTVVRIHGKDKAQKLIEINTQLNPDSEGFNDFSSTEYDLVLDDVAFVATMKEMIAQVLMEYSHNNPGSVPAELILEYSGVPFTAQQQIKEYREMQMQAAQEQSEREQKLAEYELGLKRYELELKKQEIEIKRAEALIKGATVRDKSANKTVSAKKEGKK